MRRVKLLTLLLVLAVLLVPRAASARGLQDDQVIFGGTFTLYEGESLDGSLVVFGGSVYLEQDSVVQGDVVLMGGFAEVNGTVQGNMVVFGGSIDLGEKAVVMGDVAAVGGTLNRAPGAIVHGQIVEGGAVPFTLQLPSRFEFDNWSAPRWGVSTFPAVGAVWFLFRMFMWAALAVVVAVLFAEPVERVARAALTEPLITVGAGMVTAFLAPVAALVLAITLVLLPASLALVLALGLAWLMGWVALGWEFGRRLAAMLNLDWAPAISAGVGTLILYFVLAGFAQLIPCVGSLPRLAVGFWGLGAVLLTLFGSREYSNSPRIVEAAVVSEAPAEASAEDVQGE